MRIPLTKLVLKLKTFTKKKVKYIDDKFGVYLVTGKQGSNKTYYAVQLVNDQDKKRVNYIKTNIHSLNIPGYKIEYFTKIDEIVNDTDRNVIYVIDEISKKYPKDCKCDKPFYAWLNQSRKRNRVAILITQEYLELPMWLRRPCKYMLTSMPIRFLTNLTGLYKCIVGDGYNLVYDKEEGIYTCPTVQTIIYKRNQQIASYYDTFEPIEDL